MTDPAPLTLTARYRKHRAPTEPVLYRGRTWAVTDCGIERHTGHQYVVEKDRLLGHHAGLLEWPWHIAEKGGDYDFEDFAHCFVKAVELFGLDVPPEAVRDAVAAGLAKHVRSVGLALRKVYREPIEAPLRNLIEAEFYNEADLALEDHDWKVGWDRPSPALVAAAAREEQSPASIVEATMDDETDLDDDGDVCWVEGCEEIGVYTDFNDDEAMPLFDSRYVYLCHYHRELLWGTGALRDPA